MALFCAACPQDGVNIPSDWRSEADQWRYNLTLAADGNFSLVHRAQKVNKDVWLKAGEGYLVEPTSYRYHIENAKEDKEVRFYLTCRRPFWMLMSFNSDTDL
jgi:hypothetical protein